MDSLGGLLDAPRARGAFALRAGMRSPWSLRILAESPLTLLTVIRGEFWIVPDEGEALRLLSFHLIPLHVSYADPNGMDLVLAVP